jgi:hypothetical protein
LELWHLTIASDGRQVLFPSEEARRAAVRVLARVVGFAVGAEDLDRLRREHERLQEQVRALQAALARGGGPVAEAAAPPGGGDPIGGAPPPEERTGPAPTPAAPAPLGPGSWRRRPWLVAGAPRAGRASRRQDGKTRV